MAVSELEEQGGAKRWLGYTCPECYAIFRVPTEGRGKVAECPHCRLPVRLGTQRPAAEAPAGAAGTAAEAVPDGWVRSERSGRLKKKRRVTRKHASEKHGWEESRPGRPGEAEGAKFFLVLLAGLLLLTGGVGVFMKRLMEAQDEKVVAIDLGAPAGGGFNPATGSAPPVERPGEEADPVIEVIRAIDLPATREAVDRFLKATTVDELLQTVRDPDRVGPLIRDYYRDRPLDPVPYRLIAPNGEIQAGDRLLATQVVLEDFSKRAIAVERTAGGILVDWESWVGHGEMAWEDFLRLRPERPVLMRVRIAAVDYYNFAFSDDRAWQSFRLMSGEGKTIYGYAPVDSLTAESLRGLRAGRKVHHMTLELRYPAGATRDDQVLIDKVLATGWVPTD